MFQYAGAGSSISCRINVRECLEYSDFVRLIVRLSSSRDTSLDRRRWEIYFFALSLNKLTNLAKDHYS